MRITTLSDTHTLHKLVERDLPGGDLILHAGDFTSMGYFHEIKNFCNWYSKLQYEYRLCIAGNHELSFRDHHKEALELIDSFLNMDYLEDELHGVLLDKDIYTDARPVKVYGIPWQPEFCNWAFNLPRNGWELEQKWNDIPLDTDILVTHGPPWGTLDVVKGRTDHLGCELLAERIKVVKPKIHVFGHIHSGNGYYFDGTTHFINASALNEQYKYAHTPLTFDWDSITNELNFL